MLVSRTAAPTVICECSMLFLADTGYADRPLDVPCMIGVLRGACSVCFRPLFLTSDYILQTHPISLPFTHVCHTHDSVYRHLCYAGLELRQQLCSSGGLTGVSFANSTPHVCFGPPFSAPGVCPYDTLLLNRVSSAAAFIQFVCAPRRCMSHHVEAAGVQIRNATIIYVERRPEQEMPATVIDGSAKWLVLGLLPPASL